MTLRRSPRIYSMTLAVLLCATALAACDSGNLVDTITGDDGRDEQWVNGPRRAPLLNPHSSRLMPPQSESDEVDKSLSPQMRQMAASNPFDQFDDQGNRIAPAKPTAQRLAQNENAADTQPQANSHDESLLDKWLGSWDEPSTQYAPSPDKNAGPARKPFNDRYVPVQPVTEAPLRGMPLPLMQPAESPRSANTEPAEQNVVSNEKPKEEEPSLLSKLNDSFKSFAGEESPSEVPASQSRYPALSLVPATPEQFKDMKSGKQDMVEDLQIAHSVAQEEKQQLDNEPSQQAPSVVVDAQPKPLAPLAPAATSVSEPLLLGQLSEKKKPDAELSQDTPITVAEPVVAVEATQVQAQEKTIEDAGARRTSWWDRVQATFDEPKPVPARAPQASRSQPTDNVTSSRQGVAKHLEAADEEEPITGTPLTATSNAAAEAQPAAEAADDTQPSPKQPVTANGLPSPQLLKNAPAARYNTQARDRKFYLVP